MDSVPPTKEQSRESEARYRHLFEHLSDAAFLVRADTGVIVETNRKGEELLGRSREEILGMRQPEMHPADQRAECRRLFEEFLAAGDTDGAEAEVLTKDGRVVPVHISATTIMVGGERFALGLFRDITERKRAEERVRAERDKLVQVFDAMVDGVYIVDQEHNIQYVNPVLVGEFGAYEGRKCYEYFHDRDEQCPWCKNEDVWAGKTVRWEWYSSRNDRIYDLIDTPLRNADGIIWKLEIFRDITEHKQAEEAMAASEKQYRTLVESVRDGVYQLDREGRFTFVNELIVQRSGRPREWFIGRSYLDVIVPEDHQRMQEIFEATMRGESTQPYKTVYRRASRELLHIEVNSSPLFEGDEVVGLLAVSRDITERKQAEEALRAERDLSCMYLDIAGVMLAVVDADEKIAMINTMGCRILGYTEAELVGANWFDLLVPRRAREEVRGVFRSLMADNIAPVEYYQNPLVRKDGEERLISFHNTVLRGVGGEITGALLSAEDITERKEAEEALRASEDKYRTLVSHTPAVLWTSDRNGHTSFISSNVEQVYGYTPKEIIEAGDRLWFGRIHPEDLASVKAAYAALIETGAPFEIEYRIQRKDGDWIWLHDRATRNHEVDGALRVDGVFLDVTERKLAEEERQRLEEQLRQAQKIEAVGQLAGGIAHDFNNILTIIQGNAELLKMGLPSEGEQVEFADEVIKGAKRAADLTNQLLAFARKGKWQVAPVDIHSVVTETVNILTHAIDRRIEIRLELHASPSTVMGDPTQLHSAMLNLGVNARDAMADGGVLTYTTRNVTLTKTDCDEHPCELTPGDFLEIRITDTGAGMDEQTQKRIFEPFFTTKEVGKGTGLGLAGVYGCIRSHDGSVSVSSEPGRGATFTILLPLADAGAAATARTVASDAPVRGTGHVLIVDDEESVRNFVRTSLQHLGYTVSTCDDGAAGVDYYRRRHHEIDLVILDLIMPRMNGLDAFRKMKKIKANVRVLVSSGFSHTQATRQMLDEGALALLSKPFRITELSQAVAEHIHRDSPQ